MDEVLPDVLARWPQSIIVRSIAHNFLPESDPRRQALIEEIKALAAIINDPGERMHAADTLYAAGQFSAAADMYASLYTLDKGTPALFRVLKSLFFAERRREARELFDRSIPTLKASPRYRGVMHERVAAWKPPVETETIERYKINTPKSNLASHHRSSRRSSKTH